MVQMKVTASVLIAAAAIVPAVAYGFETEDSLVAREDNDLFAREPVSGMFLRNSVHSGARHGRLVESSGPSQPQPESRELNDDLYEREPFRGGAMFRDVRTGVRHGGFRGSSGSEQNEAREFNDELSERELEVDLLERDFDDTDLFEREFVEDLTERGIDDDELFERDLELDSDLFERSPEPFSLSKWWQNLTHPKKTAKPTTDDSTATPDARDFDEMEDLTERGIDNDELFERDLEFDSDLFERSPEPFSLSKWWNNLTHPKKTAKPTTDDSTTTPDARDFDEMELLEREYYDELD